MSQDEGSSPTNLREFRMQKKPVLSHNKPSSNGLLNSYSDSEDSEMHANGAHKPSVSCSSRPVQKKSDKVLERERQVRYLIKNFPHVQSFEIYELISKVNFDLEVAVNELKLTLEKGVDIIDYKDWKEESPVKQFRPILKRERIEHIVKQSKAKKRRIDHHDEDSNDSIKDFKDNRVFDSDEDSDVEVSNELTGDKKRVLEFMQTAKPNELQLMSNCSKKKVDAIIASRPFTGWIDLVKKLEENKNLSGDILNAAQRVLITRNNIRQLMKKCASIASQLECAIKNEGGVKRQPSNLSSSLKLTNYQMVGLNWFAVLHQQGVNGILADEMGLGKTVQVISFLAHLKETKAAITTHLVVVPASTLENWMNEFGRWCPELRVLLYYGSAEERRSYRFMFAEGKHKDFDVVLTTYNMVSSSPEERKMFRVTPMHYVIFDEAHMLKNMNTQRYETLARIKAAKRILLTGTPLQNNLLELMSLLIFVMPNIFSEKADDLKSLFQKNNKKDKDSDDDIPTFEKDQVEQAKRIMKPFVLRRLKRDVLKDLPKKTDLKLNVAMVPSQETKYMELITAFQEAGTKEEGGKYNGMTMMSDLRKLANHPLLLRYHYKYEDLPNIARKLAADPGYKDTVVDYIVDDLACMSDFEIHTMSKDFACLKKFQLPDELITVSGKFSFLDEKLAELKKGGHRVLIFSQYVIMLNVLEEYLDIRDHSYLRLDGNTAVTLRQELIDQYSSDPNIFIFLLSTRAGGLGINLTAADTVIIHDIDFNPYNDRQAEDRCHRMGQTKPVTVYRLISKDTIEDGMWNLTQEKLKLEKEITSDDYENTETKSVVTLLSTALGIDSTKMAGLVTQKKKS
ncbi:PREDICTED: SWI/SNF-related matrix-associated actin-dependent regulator of chromatin subfamily A containing DEAD/H box 1 homolog isoform X2 [Nicrophorus vespilloides]|uniref:SWI/SNF-related matrix-associated actin-dependent regulator of chromatin subfamily A containing DEAD/H box 1 homolog isoform X2 n=1 Tax=Nicrophorus vespilloides TaxID=110193 RepID=A0ABM1N0S7_NICVS|nr:PREDICTED: SWI/SNF-related matrix-associated actin-dependent regulator of chromatin subfamily A containing DEAD/H box 1 homolog isoform X2 [Nicrophorus vespilloides]